MRILAICLSLFVLLHAACGDDEKPGSGAYETDRPGEVENPFTLPPGGVEWVTYLVAANAPAREDLFGSGGSAVFVGTAIRFGLARNLEGGVTIDGFLAANSRQGSGTGVGYGTLLAKWNLMKGETGDSGIALAPFVRLPIERTIGGTSRVESGVIAPFGLELEGGWELQGSTGVTRAPEGISEWSTQWENQVSLERALTSKATAYLEIQLESGNGPPAWSTEFGVTYRLSPRALMDFGGSAGIGRDSRGRMGYAGVGWGF